MSSTYTNRYGLERPATGALGGLWGSVVNNAVTTLIDDAIDAVSNIAMGNSDLTLTIPAATSSPNRAGTLRCTGAHTAERTLTVPAGDRVLRILNATTGGFNILVRNPTSGTVSVPPNQTVTIAFINSTATELSPRVRFPDGTAALPGITFDADADTGLFRPGANQVGVSAGGANRLLVTPSEVRSLVNLNGPVLATGSSVARSLTDRFGEAANVRDFGALGNGIADDTAAFQAAAASGKPIFAPPGDYRITSAIVLSAYGQFFEGAGEQTILRPVGNTDLFRVPQATEAVALQHFTVMGGAQTGGFVVNIDGGDRVDVRHIRIDHCWSGFRVFNANATSFEDVWAQSPQVDFILCEGTGQANRSDVIRIIDCNVGGPSTCLWNGLRIRGFINTVQIDRFTCVNFRRGIFVEATANEALFIVANDFEADFGLFEAVRLEEGGNFWFNMSYFQGSAHYSGSAPLIHSGPNVDNLRITDSYLSTAHGAPVLDIAGDDTAIMGCELLLPGWPNNMMNTDVVVVRGTARRVRLLGNQYGGREGVGLVARYGVRVENGARSVQVSGDFSGCRLGPILDESGAGTGDGVQVIGAAASERPLSSVIGGTQIGTTTGWGADATPTVTGGVITALTLVSGGRDYLSPPSVLFFDPLGTGSGASATAVVSGGAVTGFTGLVGGTGYSAGTTVQLRAPLTIPTVMPRTPDAFNTSLGVRASGGGAVFLGSGFGNALEVTCLDVNTVNRVQVLGRASGQTPIIIPVGPDANIDLALFPRGAGALSVSGPVTATAGSLAGYLTIKIGASPVKIPFHNM